METTNKSLISEIIKHVNFPFVTFICIVMFFFVVVLFVFCLWFFSIFVYPLKWFHALASTIRFIPLVRSDHILFIPPNSSPSISYFPSSSAPPTMPASAASA